jgi:2-methylaconitate cis-trans-isomerase PrpF
VKPSIGGTCAGLFASAQVCRFTWGIHMSWRKIPCSIYRGGTSKGVFLLDTDLPADPTERTRVLLEIFGSPDARQINGLGGATPTTSKVAILRPSTRSDADVDYTFGQVGIEKAVIDFRPNCGNIASAVGPYAVDHGLIRVKESEALVRIYNTNTDTLLHARFLVQGGRFQPDGEIRIPGVPGTGSPVYLDFFGVEGGLTGALFPTGSVSDVVGISGGRKYRVTVIDAGNCSVFVDGRELGIENEALTLDADSLTVLEEIRQTVGRELSLYPPGEVISPETHALPKIAVVWPPRTYRTSDGSFIDATTQSITARALTMGRIHPSYAVTGAIALSVAVRIPGTVPYEASNHVMQSSSFIRIGHPTGIMEVDALVSRESGGGYRVERVTLLRTARPIMDGYVWVRG